jgi:hypothetical protein
MKWLAQSNADSPFGWRRSAEPFINEQGDLCESLTLGDIYWPTDYPNLPNVLSKVRDERTALRFAGKFGLLGYYGLAPSEERDGDPLRWVLLQAQTVRLVGELLEALTHEGPEASRNALARWSVGREEVVATRRGGAEPLEERVALDQFVVVEGASTVTIRLPNVARPRYQAIELVETLVTANTAGVRFRLRQRGDGRFGEDVQPSALIEAVWWHLGHWAVDGRVRLCENPKCRAPFRVMDERQRFCPGDESHDVAHGRHHAARSMCAALDQQSKKRAAEKGKRKKGGG